jgi:hypothetical protein
LIFWSSVVVAVVVHTLVPVVVPVDFLNEETSLSRQVQSFQLKLVPAVPVPFGLRAHMAATVARQSLEPTKCLVVDAVHRGTGQTQMELETLEHRWLQQLPTVVVEQIQKHLVPEPVAHLALDILAVILVVLGPSTLGNHTQPVVVVVPEAQDRPLKTDP